MSNLELSEQIGADARVTIHLIGLHTNFHCRGQLQKLRKRKRDLHFLETN